MLQETSEHFLQRPCDERGGSQQNPECNWSAWWSPNHGKETETQMVWPHLKILWHGEDNSARTVKGARRRGRQKKRREDNIKEWTGMGFGDSLRAAEDREGWKGIIAASSVVPRRPPRLRDWEMRAPSSYCLGADSSTESIFSAIQKVFFQFFPLWENWLFFIWRTLPYSLLLLC